MSEEVVDVLPYRVDDDRYVARHSHMKYELRDTPGLGGLPVKSSKTENAPRKCATVGTVQIPQARKRNEETTVSAANQPQGPQLLDFGIVKKFGGTMDDTETVKGLVFDKNASHATDGPTMMEKMMRLLLWWSPCSTMHQTCRIY
ncbi:hypothetical protein C1H46_005535 [Malus baccata]|uniref:Uncharacterized protein n=1 Tax=Malus baccata TaxID=106549 RepID=A0A540NCP7_MALBA|nr:hypothetical protein C1H46_005535 [Malus baccata]